MSFPRPGEPVEKQTTQDVVLLPTHESNLCTRCNHPKYEHGDRAVGLCSGEYYCAVHFEGVPARRRWGCPCTGYSESFDVEAMK